MRRSTSSGVQTDTLEVIAEIAPVDARAWGLKLAAPSSSDESLAVRGEGDRLNVAGTEVPGIRFGEDGAVKLHSSLTGRCWKSSSTTASKA